MNIIKNRYWYFLLSLLVIIPGIAFMIWNWAGDGSPLHLGIDFTGGSLLEVQFKGTRPTIAEIEQLYADLSTDAQPIDGPLVQPLGEDSFAIRSKLMANETKTQIVTEMESRFGSPVTLLNFSTVAAAVEIGRAHV